MLNKTDTSVFNVADYFLKKSNTTFDLLKLMKICYLAYGWHLCFYKEPLFYEDIHAWKYGPVIPELYYTLKHLKGKSISSEALTNLVVGDLNENQKEVIDAVEAEYGKYSGLQLSTLTHQEGTPWKDTYNGLPNVIIKDKVIKKHFDLLQVGNAA